MGSSWARAGRYGGFRGRDQVQDAMLSREAGSLVNLPGMERWGEVAKRRCVVSFFKGIKSRFDRFCHVKFAAQQVCVGFCWLFEDSKKEMPKDQFQW